jgi:hypothetical protein
LQETSAGYSNGSSGALEAHAVFGALSRAGETLEKIDPETATRWARLGAATCNGDAGSRKRQRLAYSLPPSGVSRV